MNKTELIRVLAVRYDGNTAEATVALNAVTDTIVEQTAAGHKVSIAGFGVFERMHRDERVVRNPATGERMPRAAVWVPRFRAGAGFKRAVAGSG